MIAGLPPPAPSITAYHVRLPWFRSACWVHHGLATPSPLPKPLTTLTTWCFRGIMYDFVHILGMCVHCYWWLPRLPCVVIAYHAYHGSILPAGCPTGLVPPWPPRKPLTTLTPRWFRGKMYDFVHKFGMYVKFDRWLPRLPCMVSAYHAYHASILPAGCTLGCTVLLDHWLTKCVISYRISSQLLLHCRIV